MNIVLLQAANGHEVVGPKVRVPVGSYRIEKTGQYEGCEMVINDSDNKIEVNSKLILSNHSSIRLFAKGAECLTVKFVRES